MNRWSPRALWAAALLSQAGCTKLASDYTVHLVPHTLTGQEPFAEGREVELVVLDPGGETGATYYAGTIDGTELELGDLPPIAAGSAIGILVEEPGGTGAMVDIDLAAAWGSALVNEPLDTGEREVTVDVLVAEIETIGDMGTLPRNRRGVGAGVAMVPGGDVYLFGGAPGTAPADTPSSRIQWMSQPDLGAWEFEKIDTSLEKKDGVAGFYGVAASTVVVNERTLIFVSGGREEVGALPGTPTTAAFLFDPATQAFTWGHKASHAGLTVPRSEHRHVVMDNGKVVIYGGWESTFSNASIEVFNPKNKRFDWLDDVTHGPAHPAGASLGPGGALICGGAQVNNLQNTVDPVAECDTITLGGVLAPSAAMPVPVFGHAMARLADGRILATGGVTESVADYDGAPAVDTAWVYDGTDWTTISGTMKTARAHHTILPMPNGDAIILGGSETGGGIFPTLSPAVVCAELFEAKTNSFTEIKPCSGAGGGAFNAASIVPTEGAFVLAGIDTGAASPMGDAYGFIAFTPEF